MHSKTRDPSRWRRLCTRSPVTFWGLEERSSSQSQTPPRAPWTAWHPPVAHPRLHQKAEQLTEKPGVFQCAHENKAKPLVFTMSWAVHRACRRPLRSLDEKWCFRECEALSCFRHANRPRGCTAVCSFLPVTLQRQRSPHSLPLTGIPKPDQVEETERPQPGAKRNVFK